MTERITPEQQNGWKIVEPPSDAAMIERIRALGFAIPFTITGEEQQAFRLTRDVIGRYTSVYGPPADVTQVRRVCGLLPLPGGA